MLVHDGFMAQDASLECPETRPKSGVLTPASDGSSHDGSQVLSRKRKRDQIENGGGLEDLLSERFTVKVRTILFLAGQVANSIPAASILSSRPTPLFQTHRAPFSIRLSALMP